MVAIPTAQSSVTGVFEKIFQLWRFNVAVAKHHIGFALMTGKCVPVFFQVGQIETHEIHTGVKTIAHRHHVGWIRYFRFSDASKCVRTFRVVTEKAKCVGSVAYHENSVRIVTVV
ncbi:MAG TPA: hypothetical protein VFF11_00185, partial [Candidatus Binatia bacterium]|nr:hypothetical protein [Candidatus Binatia bacterium]